MKRRPRIHPRRIAGAAWCALLLPGLWSCGGPPREGGEDGSGQDPAAVEARVEQLLEQMSVEEKVGQLIQAEVRTVEEGDVAAYHLGSVLNGGGGFPGGDKHADVDDWLALADRMYDASTDRSDGGSGIPIIWGVDAVHGHNNVVGATLFPHNIGLGAANNPELMRRIGEITAREIRVTGHDWNFGPTLAVPRDDRWGRTYEGYSEDPAIVSAYARAMVEGLQGLPGSETFLGDEHVLATVKHFIADGGTERGRDQGDARGPERELMEVHAPAYFAALEAGAQTVMVSFSSWNGTKMHAHRPLLTGLLKEEMGFDGILVGDWNGHGQVPGCSNSSCAASVNAGLDMFMVPVDWRELHENTLAQVRSGEISIARIDDAVRRVLRVKIRAGVLDRGRPSSRALAGDTSILGSAEHRAVARQAVRESLVLLKNNGGLLPLAPGGRVLVLGDGAHDIGKQAGGWTLTWQGTGNDNSDFPGATSIWDGIRQAVETAGGTAHLSPGGALDGGPRPDVAIAVYGEDPYAEYQGDRPDVDFPREDAGILESLERLRRQGIPVVSVFLSGRPLWVTPELNASDAFIAAWLPGSEGGGIADVLFTRPDGSVASDFQGRLSFSWPRRPDQARLNVGDPDYDPLFPFGYGLSYESPEELPELPEERGPGVAATRSTVYFDGAPVAPWRLLVQEAGSLPIPATTGRTVTPQGAVEVVVEDRRRQDDARYVTWTGTRDAAVLLASERPRDLTSETEAGLVLAFDVRPVMLPPEPLFLTMESLDGERGRIDLRALLRQAPTDEWTTLGIPLRCLRQSGMEMGRVGTGWALRTAGRAALAFSDVRLAREVRPSVECS